MLAFLIALGLTGGSAWYVYNKLIADKLDTPQNNQSVKGLEKTEIKTTIKENEAKVKTLKEEIKTIEKERKDILAGSDAEKGDKAQEKLEAKEEKLKELKELELI